MFHVSFYRFVDVADPASLCGELLGLATGLLGTILVAGEGINGMLAGDAETLDGFAASLQSPGVHGGAFAGMVFKRTVCERMPFGRLKVKVKPELVPLDVEGIDVPNRRADIDASDADPTEWRELLHRDDVVVLDNRNSFEFEHGHFAGAVNPGIADFRDFASYVRANADEWRSAGTTIAMYCTGGIRCEKSSPWMHDLGLTVRQLRGGIVAYLAEMPDAERDWSGDCFVFDDRGMLDTHLQPKAPAASVRSDGTGETA